MKKYLALALIVVIAGCGGEGGGGGESQPDNKPINHGGTALEPNKVSHSIDNYLDDNAESNYYKFVGHAGDTVLLNITLNDSITSGELLGCSYGYNVDSNHPYVGLKIRGTYTDFLYRTCGQHINLTLPSDDLYIIESSFSNIYGVKRTGTFNLSLLKTKTPFKEAVSFVELGEYINSSYYAIENDFDNIDIDNGEILVNDISTGKKSVQVKYGDVVSVKLKSSDEVETEVVSNIYTDHDNGYFSLKTKSVDLPLLEKRRYYDEGVSRYYVSSDKNNLRLQAMIHNSSIKVTRIHDNSVVFYEEMRIDQGWGFLINLAFGEYIVEVENYNSTTSYTDISYIEKYD